MAIKAEAIPDRQPTAGVSKEERVRASVPYRSPAQASTVSFRVGASVPAEQRAEASLPMVISVNGKTGKVRLTFSDVGALPASYRPPVTSVNGKTGEVVLGAEDVGALPNTYVAPVTSVNGKTGVVTLGANDVGALPDSTIIPSKTSDLTNDSGFVNAAGAAAAAPVQSVNGQTGAVTLGANDVGALPDSTAIPSKTSDLTNDSGFVNAAGAAAAAPVQSVNGQTGSVVIDILNAVYPVGSIYMSVSGTDPGALFGGVWERIQDRFLLAAGDSYAAGATGGSATMAHTHELNENGYAKITAFGDQNRMYYQEKSGRTAWNANYGWNVSSAGGDTKSSGWGVNLGGRTEGASDDNNMPPYLAVYVWKRTA